MRAENVCTPIDREKAGRIQPEALMRMYLSMLRIRAAESAIADLVRAKEIICPCHLYEGQEAVASAVCALLYDDDFVFSNHRSHGHYLAKGGNLYGMIAEVFCRESGCSGGHGGSMHLVDTKVGFPGSSAIVGGTIPLAVGSALAFSIRGEKRVAVSFFGDGAATEGVFYEALNIAKLWNLPVVFVCENNFYSTHMPIADIQANTEVFRRAEAFNIPASRIDGSNVIDVYLAAEEAVRRARSGGGPTFIECLTYRWRGHVGPNYDIDKGLRSKDELDSWVGDCSIVRLEGYMVSTGIMSVEQRGEIRSGVEAEVKKAVEAARKAPSPKPPAYKDQVFWK